MLRDWFLPTSQPQLSEEIEILPELPDVEEEFDAVEEVDAVFRAQRKLSMAYGGLFFLAILLIPLLSITSEWWYGRPVWGGMTLNYLTVAVFFHLVYLVVGYVYTTQANRLEEEMLGREDGEDDGHA